MVNDLAGGHCAGLGDDHLEVFYHLFDRVCDHPFDHLVDSHVDRLFYRYVGRNVAWVE